MNRILTLIAVSGFMLAQGCATGAWGLGKFSHPSKTTSEFASDRYACEATVKTANATGAMLPGAAHGYWGEVNRCLADRYGWVIQ